MVGKKEKGECYWCNEKCTSARNCKNKQLFTIELICEEEEIMIEDEANEEKETPQISIHAITGVPSFSTMKFVGYMGTRRLFNLGSNHNFISQNLINKLQCLLKSISSIKVTMANGNKLECGKRCVGFKWIIQGVWFKADMLVIPLDSYDRVLEIEWLSQLGDIVWNFADLTMQFKIPESIQTLSGLQLLNLSNNELSGVIPSSIGNLTHLEALDLSGNKLYGMIPQDLVQLNFLEVFNVSNNNLSGHIPQGNQFYTFSNNSYIGNQELCGFPLSMKCGDSEESKPPIVSFKEDIESDFLNGIDLVVILIGVVTGLVIGIVCGDHLVTRYYKWFLQRF